MTEEPEALNLSALWDEHCHHESVTRDVDASMATMVVEPYVNHIPTMTGGVGHDHLKRFYTHNFVNSNPDGTRLVPISRTVGKDRVVDESCSASLTAARLTGCCPVSRRLGNMSKCR